MSAIPPGTDAPLISLGQGEYRRDIHGEDLGGRATRGAAANPQPDNSALQAELIGAALRYTAVADWFEALPLAKYDPQRDQVAMEHFNRIEFQLRKAGKRLLRRLGHRKVILECALRAGVES